MSRALYGRGRRGRRGRGGPGSTAGADAVSRSGVTRPAAAPAPAAAPTRPPSGAARPGAAAPRARARPSPAATRARPARRSRSTGTPRTGSPADTPPTAGRRGTRPSAPAPARNRSWRWRDRPRRSGLWSPPRPVHQVATGMLPFGRLSDVCPSAAVMTTGARYTRYRSSSAAAVASPAYPATAAAAAMTGRRITAPSATPSANASSVQAGYTGSVIVKYCGSIRCRPRTRRSANHHWARTPVSDPNSTSAAASTASRAAISRVRPAPWVHAYRNVPCSRSRATTVAPANAPASPGSTSSRIGTTSAQIPKSCWNWVSPTPHAGVAES